MKLLAVVVFFVSFIFLGCLAQAQVNTGPNLAKSVYDFKVKTIDGIDKNLGDYRGQVLLIVNTASRCGFTPQYAGLEELYERYKAQGLVVLAFPSNDFKDQEPGDNSAIKQFCELKYNVKFPLFAKIDVLGPQIAPLYQYLTISSGFNGSITWNFNKFLVSRQGQVIARFGSKKKPLDPVLEQEVLNALK